MLFVVVVVMKKAKIFILFCFLFHLAISRSPWWCYANSCHREAWSSETFYAGHTLCMPSFIMRNVKLYKLKRWVAKGTARNIPILPEINTIKFNNKIQCSMLWENQYVYILYNMSNSNIPHMRVCVFISASYF